MINVPQKFAKDVATILPKALNDKFEKEVENIVDIGIETYENLLFGVVASRNSMADPENFYDNYIDKLEDDDCSTKIEGTLMEETNRISFIYNLLKYYTLIFHISKIYK